MDAGVLQFLTSRLICVTAVSISNVLNTKLCYGCAGRENTAPLRINQALLFNHPLYWAEFYCNSSLDVPEGRKYCVRMSKWDFIWYIPGGLQQEELSVLCQQ